MDWTLIKRIQLSRSIKWRFLITLFLVYCQSPEKKGPEEEVDETDKVAEVVDSVMIGNKEHALSPYDRYIDDNQNKAKAGEGAYQHFVSHQIDLDGDNQDENLTLMANVEKDDQGRAMWEHGHTWQVYIEDGPDLTHLYIYHVPSGTLEVAIDQSNPSVIYVIHHSPLNKSILSYDLGQFAVDTVDSVPANAARLKLE